ncbi:histone H2B-like [Amphiprion ocellaris]|uniref:histone H2B-like n=1 Tax=Amphiprion ocellaris TaxID=80972 RepID=UPI002411894C|nr:histone H2B-like [Amphiprion ocellaris]
MSRLSEEFRPAGSYSFKRSSGEMPEPATSAPKKVSKKATSKATKTVKKRRKSRRQSYAIYMYKVVKHVHPDTSISSKAMAIMNLFVSHSFEASHLAHYTMRSTITSRPIFFLIKKTAKPFISLSCSCLCSCVLICCFLNANVYKTL